MKHRIYWLLLSCLLLAAVVPAFGQWKDLDTVPMPEPSVKGGYYEDSFTLELHGPEDGSIYYTTDGSRPTAESPLYVGGIQIADRSGEPNLCNAVQRVVPDWKNYTPKTTPVEKGTVIRAVFVNHLGMESEILTQTYFVGIQPPERGYAVSLVYEHDALFGDEGICVTGKEYDEWYLSGDASIPEPIANYYKKIEVPATVELMDPNGDVLNQPIGLRVQGDTSRKSYIKRFIFVAREEFCGKKIFDQELFEGVTSHSVMLKNNLSDAIIGDLVADRSVATQGSVPVRLYMNGEYWYTCYMLERFDEQYFRQHFDVDNRVRVRDGVTEEESATKSPVDHYQEFYDWAYSAYFPNEYEWERLLGEIDLQSFIDYIAINDYISNVDLGDTHNYMLWRSPTLGKGEYEDMRWRWCIYDIEPMMWLENAVEMNTFTTGRPAWELNKMSLFKSLRLSPEFNRLFVLSFMDLVNNNFAPHKVEPVLEKYGYDLDWLGGFFRRRPAYAIQYLAEEFELTGTLETVSISTKHPEMGSVIVNTSTIDLSGHTWSGQYFTDYPITVTAVAGDGYEFIGWKGGANETADTLTVDISGGVALEAVFAEK